MDPLSLLVGAMVGACFGAIVMAVLRSGRDLRADDYGVLKNEIDDVPLHGGGIARPNKKSLH